MDSIYELKQRMTLLERAHASAGMGHFILDPKRMTIEFSSWVRKNIGLNDMPIPLARLSEIVAEDEREDFDQRVQDLIERKQDFSFETKVVTATGKVRTQRISGITAFENETTLEGLIGYFGIIQEITNEKLARAELREARDIAQNQLGARTNLLAMVSHEIRTPLGGILGIIDQLKRERSATERDRALALIEDSSEVLLDTLDAILQQARIGENAGNLEMARFRPMSVARRVAELFRPLARRKGLQIEARGAPDQYALGDSARLQQVIANFVSNGVKFTQAGSILIEVAAPELDDDKWAFLIKDTGTGMDENRVAEIFEPFGESSSDSLGRAVGAGLGLSITRDLVEAMGGTIEVDSELGRGSSFIVRVPLSRAESETEVPPPDTTRGKLVMLVESASDRVQVEAAASMHGIKIVEKAAIALDGSSVAAPSILIADRDKLNYFSVEEFEQFDCIIEVVSEGAPQRTSSISSVNNHGLVATVPSATILRSVSDILAELLNDAA
ncbi:MAG: ATP-binding protein [Erythrobacter sp.]